MNKATVASRRVGSLLPRFCFVPIDPDAIFRFSPGMFLIPYPLWASRLKHRAINQWRMSRTSETREPRGCGRYALVSTVSSATGRLFLSAELIYRHSPVLLPSTLALRIMDLCRPLCYISLRTRRVLRVPVRTLSAPFRDRVIGIPIFAFPRFA